MPDSITGNGLPLRRRHYGERGAQITSPAREIRRSRCLPVEAARFSDSEPSRSEKPRSVVGRRLRQLSVRRGAFGSAAVTLGSAVGWRHRSGRTPLERSVPGPGFVSSSVASCYALPPGLRFWFRFRRVILTLDYCCFLFAE